MKCSDEIDSTKNENVLLALDMITIKLNINIIDCCFEYVKNIKT